MGSESQTFYSLRPFFDGSDYAQWKFKMELYLDCDSIKLWDIVRKGWEPPKATINGVKMEIDRDDWNSTQQEANHKNKKAMITLVSSMSREEVGKLQHCISAKEIWETLENHYEGNIQVRSKKVQLHVHEYELFKMKPYESITEMTNRLNALLTTLRKLGKHYSKEDVNTKILRVLPKNDWESRVTSIEESHDLSKLSTDILIGKLLTHELILRQREEEQQSKNKKSLALKASQD